MQCTWSLWFIEKGETLSAPDQGLVSASTVGECEGTLAWPLAEVWAQVEGWYHGWVCDNGSTKPIPHHRNGP